MAVSLNHTIVASKDAKAGAAWLAEMLGLPAPKTLLPFECVETANGVTLDFMTTDRPIAAQHYAWTTPGRSTTTTDDAEGATVAVASGCDCMKVMGRLSVPLAFFGAYHVQRYVESG
jgi:hypothetical protein